VGILVPKVHTAWAVVLVAVGVCGSPCTAADFYVATNGNDASGDGSSGNPWATVQKAVTGSRTAGTAAQKNIILRGGSYYNVMVTVDQFSDANITFMPYPGETPVLYGGQPLTNWTSAGSNNWYVASLGTFPSSVASSPNGTTSWQPRMLLADGVVCTRGRLPATGKYHYASLSGTTLTYTNSFPATTNMELMIDKSWSDSEMYVTAINTTSNTLTLNASVSMGPNTPDVKSFAVVNIPEAINGDNQFWWNKTNNAIIYRSPGNVDPNTKSMIVATTSRMLWVKGYSAASAVTNIVLSNLTFACANTVCGDGGTADDYAKDNHDAIRFSNATNCVVDRCTIFGVAGNAIGNENYSADWNLTIQNTTIHDVGGGAINLPGTTQTTVSNCLIYNTGLICQAGPGVLGFTYGGRVLSNTITNCMGAGVLMLAPGGGLWAQQTIVTDNKVIRCVKALRDMGAIYGGYGDSHVIMRNYIAEINGTNSDNGGVWDPFLIGIYSDQGSKNWTVASNVTYNCTRPMIYHNSTNGFYLNNFFVGMRPETNWIMFHNADKPLFSQNIFTSAMQPQVNAENSSYSIISPELAVQNWSSNIFWSTGAAVLGAPTNTVKQDPQFLQTTPSLEGSFGPSSPAPTLGIQSLQLRGMALPLGSATDLRILR
jgi:hypothetical protein